MGGKFSITLVLIIAWVFCCGMSSGPKKESDIKPEVERTLFKLESVYERQDLKGIRELLDKDYEDYLGFLASLETYFQGAKTIELGIVSDSFLTNRDLFHVRLHWFKTIIDTAGALLKTNGTSEFIFKKTPSGLKLLKIRKDNPFF